MRRALALLVVASGCAPFVGGDGGPGFDDHTRRSLDSRSDFFAWAAEGPSSDALKFTVSKFAEPEQRGIRFMDAGFYALHDEWYWFRLLNGQEVPGSGTEPVEGDFETVAAITAWAKEQDPEELPLDLRFVGERLYSPLFYQLALASDPRVFGLGTLLRFPAGAEPSRPERFAFELEYQDALSHDELAVFFTLLDDALPPGLAGEVRWLIRSPAQEALAVRMEAEGLRYHDRLLRYDEVTVPGAVEVYSPGLVAGRVRLVPPGGQGLEQSRSTDVLVLAAAPDFLPPTTGLLTAVPQTPLAHINLLAKNRGIPNAYVAGVLEDPHLDQLSRVRAPMVFLAEQSPDRVLYKAISEEDYATWRALVVPRPLAVPFVDVGALPYAHDLAALSLEDSERLRREIGGKAAGFLALLEPGSVVMPDAPLALTVRAYAEHIAPFRAGLAAMLGDGPFRSDARVRFLVLEGEPAYRARFSTPGDLEVLDDMSARPAGDALRVFVEQGGVRAVVEARPLEHGAFAAIADALYAQFGHFSPRQGLRFRSSSNVEDIEGFSGAGLYESHTGFLFPDEAEEPGRDVERAIKRVWASYWGSEAFEERELERVEHLSGHMGVLVHARFDDESEMANGVFTYTLFPSGSATRGLLEVNVQRGALSVTNPPPGSSARPEVVRVSLGGERRERPVITRVAGSTELPAGEHVLDDAALLQIFEQARAVSEAWLVADNRGLLQAQKRRSLVLDFELRQMAAGWPALQSGQATPQRLVIKQARSLEPGLARVPSEVRALPFPRDVLGRARRVERRLCSGPGFTLLVGEALTDPLKPPDLGHADEPFTAYATLDVLEDMPALGFVAGQRISLVHPAHASVAHPGLDQGGWGLHLEVRASRPEASLLSALRFVPDQGFSLQRGDIVVEGEAGSCELTLLHSTPEELLRALVQAGG